MSRQIYPATFGRRAWAYLIDLFVITFLISLIGSYNDPFLDDFLASGAQIKADDEAWLMRLQESLVGYMFYYLRVYIPVYLLYHGFFVWYMSATIGKFVMKIRCVDTLEFGKISLGGAFLRAFLRLLCDVFFYIGFIPILTNQARQGWHDKVAKTVVIGV